LVDELNAELRKLAASNPGKVALVDWGHFARELGEQRTYDRRFWFTSGAPFASSFLSRYASTIAGVVRALSGRVRKCVVLDCDNTLWGGVIGEDGRDGIQLSSDTLPGAYFREFQRAILDLHARGVAVALCSKNDEADVFDVLDHHPDCLIRREHLAAWRINWNDKAHSIGEIADELNLGLDSLVFVDDSPQECALVTHALPAVLVRRTPNAPAELVNFLGREGLFDALEITAEDLERTRTYQQTRERNEYASSMDMVEYKAQLQTHLYVRTAVAADVARVTQLLQRTNQFNLTTRRRDPVEVRRLLDDPDVRVLCARLTDRFGDLGVIAAAIVLRRGSEAVVDSMLMSCRALGRDAELAFASSVYAVIDRTWKPNRIRAEYVRTERNSLVADFWERAGLMRDSESPHGATYQSVGNLSALAKALSPPDVTVEEEGVDGQ
jgi:FkbH-like protein